jgi:hypothetical protein
VRSEQRDEPASRRWQRAAATWRSVRRLHATVQHPSPGARRPPPTSRRATRPSCDRDMPAPPLLVARPLTHRSRGVRAQCGAIRTPSPGKCSARERTRRVTAHGEVHRACRPPSCAIARTRYGRPRAPTRSTPHRHVRPRRQKRPRRGTLATNCRAASPCAWARRALHRPTPVHLQRPER